MKYLIKFESLNYINENLSDDVLKVHNILTDIFAELIDDKTIQVDITIEDNELVVNIKPWTQTQKMAYTMPPEEMVSRYEKYLELVKDISVCYKRAVDELGEGKRRGITVASDNRIYMGFTIPGYKKEEYPF